MRRRGRSAFTLLEVLLVIALLGVVAAYALPSFFGSAQREQLDESARRFKASFAMCRAEAMNEARIYRIQILPDGRMRVQRQVDPLYAPQYFNPVQSDWSATNILLDDVWVESVQLLPDGPAPILIVDENLEVADQEVDLTSISDFEDPIDLDIAPDGSCPSFRCVLRDVEGYGVMLSLDGRLGRLTIDSAESITKDDVLRPEPYDLSDEETYDAADFKDQQ